MTSARTDTRPPPVRTFRHEAGRGITQARTARRDGVSREIPRYLALAAVNAVAVAGDRLGVRRVHCPACGWEGSRFRAKGNALSFTWQAECPACQAADRHRALALVLPTLGPATAICHFAPEEILRRLVVDLHPAARYETADLFRTDVDHPGQDIQALTLPDGAYDLVLCNHVLEHVVDDGAAITELARITSPGGTAVVTVPGTFDRAETVELPGPDANGHLRDYGSRLSDVLAAAFTGVEVIWTDALDTPGRRATHLHRSPIFLCRR